MERKRDSVDMTTKLFLLGMLISVLFIPFAAEGSDDLQKALGKGIGLYEKGDFNSAIQEFRQIISMLKNTAEGEVRNEGLFTANLYVGMSYLGMGKEASAKEFFVSAVKAAPHKSLNPDLYPPKVISLYNEALSMTVAALTVRANAPNAEVFVDDKKIGTAPVVIRTLLPGIHQVRVVAGGQESVRTTTLEPDRETTITFDFKASGSVSISSEPSSAGVYLDGKLLGTSPFLIKEVPAGEHILRLSKDGHEDYTQRVIVKENEVSTVNAKLEPVAHRVKITSVPENASVLWNDLPRGRTPLVIENVTPGVYQVTVSLDNHDEVKETIEVKTPLTEKTYRLSPHSGGMNIKSQPAGAQVLIEGKPAGSTPLSVSSLPVKQYLIRLKKEGYKDRELTVIIAKDKMAEIQETLLELDNLPPEIIFDPPAKAIKENKNIITARVIDNQAVGEASLMLKMEGEMTFQGIKMASAIKGIYEALIPDMYLKKGAVLEYYISACDIQNNCALSGGKSAPYRLKVISLEPYTEGFVLDLDGDRSKVTVSLGTVDGVKKQDRYVVFRVGKELRDPRTGELLQIEEVYVGTISIKELMPRTSYAVVDDSHIPIARDDRIRKRVSAPAGVVTEGSHATKISLRWAPNREPEVKGYRIFRSSKSDSGYVRKGEVDGRDNTVYEDTEDMMEGLTYYYQIAAYNRFGTDGILSEPVMGKTKKGVLPPENIGAEAPRVREISLRWSTAKRDGDIEKYIIYRAESPSGPFVEVARVDRDNDSFIDRENLRDGKAYYYRVAGLSRYGSVGDQSAAASARTKEGPPPPQEIRSTGMVRAVKLQWNKHPDPEVAGYIVYRNDRESGSFTETGKTDKPEFIDKDLADGKTYYYIIASYYYVKGMEIMGPNSRTVSGGPKGRPAAPGGFSAGAGLARKVVLKWDAGTEKDLAEYWIYRGVGGSVETSVHARVKAGVTSFTDMDLKDNLKYSYAVRAVDADGLESDLSPLVQASTKPLPAAPSGLKWQSDQGRAVLRWEANKEKDLTGYNVYKKGWLKGDLLTFAKENFCELKPDDRGKKMSVYVTAVDSDGLESAPSEEIEVLIP